MGITVVIPYHPARESNGMLDRAVASVRAQTFPAAEIITEPDLEKEGAAPTRHRGLMKVSTEWVAFLDSDDEFLPNHLEVLHTAAQEHEADYVFSWFETVPPGRDPFPQHFGKLWDNNLPRHTTITTLVRTSIAQQVGFLKYGKPGEMICSNEDWFFTLGCLEAGAKFYHVPERTWRWYHHGKNSSGMPTKGDAR